MSSTPAPIDSVTAMTHADVIRIVRKHLLLVLACWVTLVAVVAFWTMGQPRIYRAESLLRLDPDPPRPLGQQVDLMTSGPSKYWNHREFYETEFRVMRSRRVALAVVRQLALHADPDFLGVPPARRSGFIPSSPEDAAYLLVARLSVEPVKDSSLVYLRYEDTDAKRAQSILATVVRTYLDQNLETTTSVSTNAVEWLNGQLETLKVELEKSELALNAFRTKNNVLSVSLEDRHNMTTGQMEALSKEMTTLDIRRSELAARSAELAKLKGDDPLEVGATELLGSSLLSTLRVSYAEQSRNYEELTSSLGEQHPKVVSARAKLEVTRKGISAEIKNIKDAIARDLRAVDRQIRALKSREDEVQKQGHDLQTLATPYNQLSRTKSNNEKLYSLVLERARQTDLTRMLNFNNVRVVDEPVLPRVPIRPSKGLNLMIAAAAGLLLGVAVAVARELADRSIKTPEDIETMLGVTCLGLIPQIESAPGVLRRGSGRNAREAFGARNTVRDLVVAERPESGVAEAMRAVRTNLTFMSPDRPYRTLVVTSALPEEGKTTVACSLAIVLAQSGARVLLIDTDLRRPRLHRTFRASNDVGVTMAVSGQAAIEDCIQESGIENLSVLTSGPIPPNPAELLHSERFRALLTELSKRYDRIILDSPPILPVTDAAVLSRHVDGVVLVARGHRTHRAIVRQAVRLFKDVNSHIVGVVLNAIDLNRRDYGATYYYRRDGYYSRDRAA